MFSFFFSSVCVKIVSGSEVTKNPNTIHARYIHAAGPTVVGAKGAQGVQLRAFIYNRDKLSAEKRILQMCQKLTD